MERDMKKPQFKLLKEFKTFISKGSVLDLAVGMIIGSAFTAIITALVNGILKPLINWIPLGETGLQTVLREAKLDEAGNVLVEALVLDWGAVISAVITFLLTALVLFAIIKAINTARDLGKKSAEGLKKQFEKNGKEEAIEDATAEQSNEVAEVAEEPAPVTVTADPTLELLKEIRDLLKSQQVVEAQSKLENIEE